MDAAFAPPSRRTTYSKLQDNEFEPRASQRVTTGNLEAQNPFSDPHGSIEPQGIPISTIESSDGHSAARPQKWDDGNQQFQQNYVAADSSAQAAPGISKTVFPPLVPRRRFNKHIMIPSVIALMTLVIVVTLVICYVAGAFGG
ncbi:MAG: hypothetical protein HETSPECPRED_006965 [Heterodermia speciosa]|uniref:Uncharacterized protein n=1 Tax=Heterodermia speciosa TaxID=116794 RepID=A0A8H3FTM4_9LECA|nr:MAG: hypothetical protein HETSPECPRED_006965 [Heterodermia speciosa]